MKVCLIQPKYSTDYQKIDDYFNAQLKLLDSCDDSADIIVMPEMCDIPCLAPTKELADAASEKFNKRVIDAASEAAIRCNSMVFISARHKHRNATYVINRKGETVGHYYKQHLTPGEVNKIQLDSDYSFEFSEPTVIELEGIRFAFLTCYDFYFYEAFANIARNNVDVIIGCSHQRSDTHLALEIMSQFLAYNTNAYVLRSSVSMDENSDIGGASMVVAPTGEVLLNMKSRVGVESVDIDVFKKYYKPAGFGNPDSAHYEYIEKGRRPWKYRPSGSAICRHDDILPYPRVCAHRGFNTVAPENSMAAFGAAIAMGADEIEFDLWFTKDGEIVSTHDSSLERVSDGVGKVYDHSLSELLQLDFGSKFGERFAGLKIVTFEEILKKFSCHTVMNIHIKSIDNPVLTPAQCLEKIAALIHKYDCEKYVYIMSGDDSLHELARDVIPHIRRCMGAGKQKWEIVDRAIKYGCDKVQLFKPYFDKAMVDKAHAHGIICNVFYADDPNEAQQYIDMGIDTILTNDYNLVAKQVKGN